MSDVSDNLSSDPIVLIDDDLDDIFIIKHTLEELGVTAPIHVFEDGNSAIRFLSSVSSAPSLILCDINVLKETGIDIRKRIAADERLHQLCIPFILLSTAVSDDLVREAYKLPVQGIFIKQVGIEECKEQMHYILGYWSRSITPSLSTGSKWHRPDWKSL